MNLYFLGTGAGRPAVHRNTAGIILQPSEQSQEIWLFDCGEGTQQQILRSPYNLRKITNIFITHLHGDHVFGLPGLVSSRSFTAQDQPLSIYGPAGLREFLLTALRLSGTNLTYPLDIREIQHGSALEVNNYTVKVMEVEHVLPSFGYRIEEPDRPGRLNVEKLQALNIPPGPIYGQLKSGAVVTLPGGEVLRGSDFVGPPQPGRRVVIVGDSRSCQAAVDLAQGADVLVHEATFEAASGENAFAYFHSTTAQAAEIAKKAGVRQLVLTHLSSRYTKQAEQKLLAEAQRVFPNTVIASDHLSVPVTRTPLGF